MAVAACGGSDSGQTLADEMTRDQVRQYLLEHPELVLDDSEVADSIERTRSKRNQERAASRRQSLLEKRADLLNSPLTPSHGESSAALTIIEFYDYRCPPCMASHPGLEQVRATQADVRIVYGQLPIYGSHSTMAARAAIAAHRQGLFDAFHAAMMTPGVRPDMDSLYATAEEVGLDIEKLRTDMRDPQVHEYLEEIRLLAEALGVTGTPVFIIGDTVLRGGATADDLTTELSRQRAQIKKQT